MRHTGSCFQTGILQTCALELFMIFYHFLDLIFKIDITVSEDILGIDLSVKNALQIENRLKPVFCGIMEQANPLILR